MFRGKTVLVVDDSEINRAILCEMLSERYNVVEAQNGVEALDIVSNTSNIDIILLDINMPQVNGFEVLKLMKEQGIMQYMPVVMISAENSDETINKCYDLGAIDYIKKPFDTKQVLRRVQNTLMLYSKQADLEAIVVNQLHEQEMTNIQMVEILSNIVEFRNNESGMHVTNIRQITRCLMDYLYRNHPELGISLKDVKLASTASAMHDIGKIVIPESILNKPGRLTEEEFAIIKTHSISGYNLLHASPSSEENELIETAAKVCRWHHERWDGKGYPDGLKENEIPLVAQVVGIADAYDALTSERCYKKAFTCEKSLDMIKTGQCGIFNPMLIDAMLKIKDLIKKDNLGQVHSTRDTDIDEEMESVIAELMNKKTLTVSNRAASLLEKEIVKNRFYAELSDDIRFEHNLKTNILTISEYGAKIFNLDISILSPETNTSVPGWLNDICARTKKVLKKTTTDSPRFKFDYMIDARHIHTWYRVIGMVLHDDFGNATSVMGKLVNINDEKKRLEELERLSNTDSMTGLFNKNYAEKLIAEKLESEENKDKKYLLSIIDLNKFKHINDTYGHDMGDKIIKSVAEKLKEATREGDIVSRFGGDEYVVFLEYKSKPEKITNRILDFASYDYEGIPVRLSMGVALSNKDGNTYKELFKKADIAMYSGKKAGEHGCRYYKKEFGLKVESLRTEIDS